MSVIAAPPALRPATVADQRLAGAIIGAAFDDDPVAKWYVPGTGRRLEAAMALYAQRLWLPHGECLVTQDGMGIATWVPPGRSSVPVAAQLRLLPPLVRMFGHGLMRLFAGQAVQDAHHPHEPHWYLPMIAVRPEAQGRGIGSALLEPVLRRCDDDGMPAYLEATTERSRALYERHGFEQVAEVHLPKGGPPLWPMRREPA
jgi:ribosomal protein S18 acetylase RimI-like enzyme